MFVCFVQLGMTDQRKDFSLSSSLLPASTRHINRLYVHGHIFCDNLCCKIKKAKENKRIKVMKQNHPSIRHHRLSYSGWWEAGGSPSIIWCSPDRSPVHSWLTYRDKQPRTLAFAPRAN